MEGISWKQNLRHLWLKDGDRTIGDTTVVVSPDYIIYGDMHINESQLTFSCCYIKVEGSSACGIKVPFSFKWTVGDIINIESQWCGQVETAVVKLHLKSKDMKAAENTNTSSGFLMKIMERRKRANLEFHMKHI
ncbi:hypothetical protein CsSME_00009970 [Camellia sinensis var. sinensis]